MTATRTFLPSRHAERPAPIRRSRHVSDFPVLVLQRAVGNRAVATLLSGVHHHPTGGVTVVSRDVNLKPAPRSFGLVLSHLNTYRYTLRGYPEKAEASARELLTTAATREDWLKHATELAAWAQESNLPDLRDRFLEKAEQAWKGAYANKDLGVMKAASTYSLFDGPEKLAQAAKSAAAAGDHVGAMTMLRHAHRYFLLQILDLTRRRDKELQEKPDSFGFMAYGDAGHVYDRLRDLYAIYPTLANEARAAKDDRKAANLAFRAEAVRQALASDAQALLPDVVNLMRTRGPAMPSMVAEVKATDRGLELRGANSVTETLTELPGLPPTSEVGNNIQIQDVRTIDEALYRQAEMLADLQSRPEVQKELGGAKLDLNNLSQRLRVWKALYKGFKASGGKPLKELMAIQGRYLRAFTIHTNYNVRDFGTNYVDSPMPTDLAGRAERDCGVYALMVAWETYSTLKKEDPGAKVQFRLIALLDHVALVIDDQSAAEYYLVNNDTIIGPKTGNALQEMGPTWAALRGRRYAVGLAVEVPLGKVSDAAAGFKSGIWSKYKTDIHFQLRATLPETEIKRLDALKASDPDAFEAELSRVAQNTYKTYYESQKLFDAHSQRVERRLDAILAASSPDKELQGQIGELTTNAVAAAGLFTMLAGHPTDSKQPVAFVFSSMANRKHPLARAAMAFLRFRRLGGTLTTDQETIIKLCDSVTLLKDAVDEYVRAGTPAAY